MNTLNKAVESAVMRYPFRSDGLWGARIYGRFIVRSHGVKLAECPTRSEEWVFEPEHAIPAHCKDHYWRLHSACAERYKRLLIALDALYPAPPAPVSPPAPVPATPATPARMADFFERSSLAELLEKSHWAILTAANPCGQRLSREGNTDRNISLRCDLQVLGAKYLLAEGCYGGQREPSLAVVDITPESALELARDYGQESIVTREGLVFTDGRPTLKATGIILYPGHTEPEADFTTIVGFGDYFTFVFEG